MGTFLTDYGHAGDDHEGYPAQVLDDGTITGTYSADTTPRMVGQVVAACGCGWTGTTRYPTTTLFDEAAQTLALAEWQTTHAIPVLEQDRSKQWDRIRRFVEVIGARVSLRFDLKAEGLTEAELLEHTLRDLATATELAHELREQARSAEPRAGGAW